MSVKQDSIKRPKGDSIGPARNREGGIRDKQRSVLQHNDGNIVTDRESLITHKAKDQSE